eukprot:PhF_6_TR7301/c0_g1_i1/m.10921
MPAQDFKRYLSAQDKKIAKQIFYKVGGMTSCWQICQVLRDEFGFYILPEMVDVILRNDQLRQKEGGFIVTTGLGVMRMSQWYTLLGFLKFTTDVEAHRRDVEDAYESFGGNLEDGVGVNKAMFVQLASSLGVDVGRRLEEVGVAVTSPKSPYEEIIDFTITRRASGDVPVPFETFSQLLERCSNTSSTNTNTNPFNESSTTLPNIFALQGGSTNNIMAQSSLAMMDPSIARQMSNRQGSAVRSKLAKKLSRTSMGGVDEQLSISHFASFSGGAGLKSMNTSSMILNQQQQQQPQQTLESTLGAISNAISDSIKIPTNLPLKPQQSTGFLSGTNKKGGIQVLTRDVACQTKYTMKDYEAYMEKHNASGALKVVSSAECGVTCESSELGPPPDDLGECGEGGRSEMKLKTVRPKKEHDLFKIRRPKTFAEIYQK